MKNEKAQDRNADANKETKQKSSMEFSSRQYERRFETAERTCEAIAIIMGLLGSAMAVLGSQKIAIAWCFGLAVIAAVLALLFWYTDSQLKRLKSIESPSPIRTPVAPPIRSKTPLPATPTSTVETPSNEPINFTPKQIREKIDSEMFQFQKDRMTESFVGLPVDWNLVFNSATRFDDRRTTVYFIQSGETLPLVAVEVPTKGNERLPLTEENKKFRVRGEIEKIDPLSIRLKNATFEPVSK